MTPKEFAELPLLDKNDVLLKDGRDCFALRLCFEMTSEFLEHASCPESVYVRFREQWRSMSAIIHLADRGIR